MTATREQIVWHFLNLRDHSGNWGTSMDNSKWEIGDTGTYINGIVLSIDGDYWGGELLEIVEHESSVVSYVAITCFHGPKRDEEGNVLEWEHDSAFYDPPCGIFFERTPEADHRVVSHWALDAIYNMADSYFEWKDEQRAKHHAARCDTDSPEVV